MATRPFQVVVFGATGFTGRLVCEHLLNHYPNGVRWAMAGRSKAKLDQVKQELADLGFPAAHDVPMLLADTADQASIDAMVGATQVVVSTAGPYTLYGTPLVDAAVRLKTHVCDITGETWWIKDLTERFHYRAAEAGVKIVNCCGYDSIPMDMGTLFAVDHMATTHNKKMASIQSFVIDTVGGVSGGTIASGLLAATLPRETLMAAQQPYYISNPPDERGGPDGPDTLALQYSKAIGRWTTLSIMSACNSRIVRRSWALLGRRYGSNFSYTERMAMPSLVMAALTTVAIAAGQVLLTSRLLQPLVKALVPKQGEGPSRQALTSGRYRVLMVATSEAEPGERPTVVKAEVKGHGDPGYWEEALKARKDVLQGGVLTPASAGGAVLMERLRAMGTQFNVLEEH